MHEYPNFLHTSSHLPQLRSSSPSIPRHSEPVRLLHYDVVNMPIISGMPRPVQHLCWAYMFYNRKPLLVRVMCPKKHTCKNSGVMLCNLCIVCVISYEYEKYRNGVFSTLSTIEMYSLFCDICNTELTLWILQFWYRVFKTHFLPHKSYCINIIKTKQSMLLGETTAVYSENHTKYMTLCEQVVHIITTVLQSV